jgi:serine/threonine-protein kinase HipA
LRLDEAKDLEQLDVYKGTKLAGKLMRTLKGVVFSFDDAFLAEENKGISFHLRTENPTYTYYGDSLPPFFAGLLPEGLRLKALISKIKTSEDDLFSILATVGSQCIGDINVFAPGHTFQARPNNPTSFDQLDFYKLFEESLEDVNYNEYNQALSGVQEKISASMISFPINHAQKDKFYILKLNPKDKPHLVENEHLSLKLAKKCGLSVNASKIIYDKKGQHGLLVERFDRFIVTQSDKKSMTICMHHQEDGCQFLDRYPADKYRISFKDVLQGIAQYTTAPKIEILKAIQLYAYSYLIGNGDLHAKNISIQTLSASGRTVLSPCYDLITTYIYQDHKMALKVNGRDDNITRQDFITLGASFSIPEKSISSMLDKLITLCEKHHPMLFAVMNAKQQTLWITMFNKRLIDLKA